MNNTNRFPILGGFAMGETYVVDNPNVMHETMDDEVIVVDLDTGAYFSFDGAGALIWALLAGGTHTRESILAFIADRFDLAVGTIEAEVGRFLDRLLDEKLVRLGEPEAAGRKGSPGAPLGDVDLIAYAPPVLNKFTDLQALLLVDPIHEVGDAGWPSRRE